MELVHIKNWGLIFISFSLLFLGVPGNASSLWLALALQIIVLVYIVAQKSSAK